MKKHTSLFESATLRLTAWYVAILMVLSVLCSSVVYTVAGRELDRAYRPIHPGQEWIFGNREALEVFRQERIREGRESVLRTLVLFNLSVFVGGTGLSYLLARRTLSPIEVALTAQARFTSDAAHELRTPLAVMQAEAEVELRSKRASKQSHQKVLRSNLEEVMRMRILTDRLLSLASSEAIEVHDVKIRPVVQHAIEQYIPLAKTKSIIIIDAVEAHTVRADEYIIQEIVGILLDNAIKYSPKKSSVYVTTVRRKHALAVEVRDEGPGIDKNEQVEIFERFYRSDVSRTKHGVEGYGLGLPLARRLAESIGGMIDVHSAKANGSTFTLTIPLK